MAKICTLVLARFMSTHDKRDSHGDRNGDLQILAVHGIENLIPGASLAGRIVTVTTVTTGGPVDEVGLQNLAYAVLERVFAGNHAAFVVALSTGLNEIH